MGFHRGVRSTQQVQLFFFRPGSRWSVGPPPMTPTFVWLQHLYSLVHVDLSYNSLRLLESAHAHLGNIKTLNLCGNHLDHVAGLTKLYSLVNLDLSHNQLAVVSPGGPCAGLGPGFARP